MRQVKPPKPSQQSILKTYHDSKFTLLCSIFSFLLHLLFYFICCFHSKEYNCHGNLALYLKFPLDPTSTVVAAVWPLFITLSYCSRYAMGGRWDFRNYKVTIGFNYNFKTKTFSISNTRFTIVNTLFDINCFIYCSLGVVMVTGCMFEKSETV